MKKVMFALCFMLGGTVTLIAQDNQDTTSNQYQTEQQSQYPQDMQGQDQQMQGQDQQQFGNRVQPTELPEEVKTALEGEEFRGWLISGAFKADRSSVGSDTTSTDPSNQAFGTEGEEIYIVELKNGAETKTVAFDSNGQEIELESIEGQGLNEYNQEQNNQNNQDPNNQYNQDNQEQSDQYNQNNQEQSDQYNQNDQMDETTPSPHQTTPDQTTPDQSTPDQSTFDQPGQIDQNDQQDQSTETPGDQSTSDRP